MCYWFYVWKEIYERENSLTKTSEEYLSFSRVHIEDTSFIITYLNSFAQNIPNIHYLLTIDLVEFSVDENLNIERTVNYPGIIPCNQDLVNNKFEKDFSTLLKISELGNIDTYCLNSAKKYFQNPYSNLNNTFLNLRIAKCNPLLRKDCSDYINDKTKEIFTSLSFQSSILDPSNYSHPINYYYERLTQQISSIFLKRSIISFSNNVIITDKGWLLENKQIENYISLSNIVTDINENLGDMMYWITFESPHLRKSTKRHYMKIQELFAKLGGFFNGIFILFELLTWSYIDYKYYDKIFHDLINEEDNNNKENEKINQNCNENLHSQSPFVSPMQQRIRNFEDSPVVRLRMDNNIIQRENNKESI